MYLPLTIRNIEPTFCDVGITLRKKSKVFAIGGVTLGIFMSLQIDYQ